MAVFSLESATPRGLSTMRVRYTIPPLAVSSRGEHDALNPARYVVVGYIKRHVIGVAKVASDPNSVDCFLDAPLAVGSWNVTVSGVSDANGIETI